MPKFEDGAHSPSPFARAFLTPLFEAGVIYEFPGADYYAICYGELCAYADEPDPNPALAATGHKHLLAVWSKEVPDCSNNPAATAANGIAKGWYRGRWNHQPA